MDALLKNAQQAVAPIATPIENLIGGAVHAVQQAFTPAPISPVPQQQTMPQAQPNSIQSLLSTLPQETMGALNMVSQMFNNNVIKPVQNDIQQWGQQNPQQASQILQAPQQFQSAIGQGVKTVGNFIGQQPLLNNPTPIPGLTKSIGGTIGSNLQAIPDQLKQFSQGFTTPASEEDTTKGSQMGAYSLGNFLGNDLVGGAAPIANEAMQTGKAGFNLGKGLITGAAMTTGQALMNQLAGNKQSLQSSIPTFALTTALGSITNGEVKPAQLDEAMAAFTHAFQGSSELWRDISKTPSKDTLDEAITQLAGKNPNISTDPYTQNAIKLATFIDNGNKGLLTSPPRGIGLSVNDIRNGEQPEAPVANAGLYDAGKQYHWFNNQEKQFQPVKNAKQIEVVPGIDTFISRNPAYPDSSGWTITEARSGMKVADGKTQAEALQIAKDRFAQYTGKPQDLVNKAIEYNGQSPRYNIEEPPLPTDAYIKSSGGAQAGLKATEPVAMPREVNPNSGVSSNLTTAPESRVAQPTIGEVKPTIGDMLKPSGNSEPLPWETTSEALQPKPEQPEVLPQEPTVRTATTPEQTDNSVRNLLQPRQGEQGAIDTTIQPTSSTPIIPQEGEATLNNMLKGGKYKVEDGISMPAKPSDRENPLQVTNPNATVRDARAKMDTAKTQIEQRGKVVQNLVNQGIDQSVERKAGESATNFGENKLFRQAIEHPEQEDAILKQVTNPTKFKTGLDALRQFTDFTYDMAKKAGSQVQYLKNYYSHILDLSDPAEKARYDDFIAATAKNFKGWFNKQRVFANIEDLEKNGFKLKNANVVNDVADYTNAFSKEQGARVLSNELVQNFPGKAVVVNGEGTPINSIQSRISGTKGLYLSQDLHKQLADLEPAIQSRAAKVISHINNADKEMRLSGGLFHVQNTGWDYLSSNVALGRFPRVLTAARVFLSPGAYVDYMKGVINDGTLDKMAQANISFDTKQDFAGSNNLLQKTGKVIDKINPLSQLNKATFSRLMNYFKIEAFKALDNRGLIDTSTPEGLKTAQGYGREINNMFGGQNRTVGDDIFNKSPQGRFIANNLLALAPDYQQGRFKRTFSAFGIGNGSLNPLNRTAANNYAAYTLLTRMVLTGVAAAALRRAVTGKFSPNLISAVQNDIFDPNFPTPWQNTSAGGTKENEVAHLPATNISDIYRLIQDPTHFVISHSPAALSDYTAFSANQNYFGDKLSQTNNPIEKLLKVGQNDLPIPVVQGQKVMSGHEAPGNALINELGARVSLSPTDPMSVYFKNKDAALAPLNVNQQLAVNYYMTSAKNGGLSQGGDAQIMLANDGKNWSWMYPTLKQIDQGEQVHNPILSQPEAQAKAYYTYLTMNPQQQAEYVQNHPEMLNNVKSMQQYWSQTAVASGKQPYAQNPLYSFPNKTIANYMEYEVQNKTAPGGPDEKAFLKAHPDVLPVIQAISQYYAQNPVTTQSPISAMMPAMTMAYPQASSYVQQQLNNKNYNDPQVQSYLTNHLDYVNQERANSGLAPINSYGAIQGAGGAGAASLSSSTVSFLRRAIGKNERYNSKAAFQKVSQAFGRAGQPTVRYYTQHPKFATRPIGNKRSMGGMLAKGRKGYSSKKGRTTSSLMASTKRPRYKTLPIPKTGKPKNVFLMG